MDLMSGYKYMYIEQEKNNRIGVTVHSHCVEHESFRGLLQRWRRGRGCSEL